MGGTGPTYFFKGKPLGTRLHYHEWIFLNTPKNTCQIFLPKKYPEIENFKPQKNRDLSIIPVMIT